MIVRVIVVVLRAVAALLVHRLINITVFDPCVRLLREVLRTVLNCLEALLRPLHVLGLRELLLLLGIVLLLHGLLLLRRWRVLVSRVGALLLQYLLLLTHHSVRRWLLLPLKRYLLLPVPCTR